MAIVDERGRLFGRWNLLDVGLLVLIAGLVPMGYAAYVLFREQPPRIITVSPNQVEQNTEFRLMIKGQNLRPYMRASAGVNQASEFHFKSTEEAELPFQGLPPGTYDVILYDQAQERVRLTNGLTVTPSSLPPTEIVAIGAFGNLTAADAAKLTAGTDLPQAGRIASVGKPIADLTQVFSNSALIGVPIPNALRLPAIVVFKCYVRAQQGRPYCVVGDATVAPPALVMLSTPVGKTPFQIEYVRSALPLQPVPVEVRIAGNPEAIAQIKVGDMDLSGTTNELAMSARVASIGPVRQLGPGSADVTVHVTAQLQAVDHQWIYDALPLRIGSVMKLRTGRYEVAGVVTAIPPADVPAQ